MHKDEVITKIAEVHSFCRNAERRCISNKIIKNYYGFFIMNSVSCLSKICIGIYDKLKTNYVSQRVRDAQCLLYNLKKKTPASCVIRRALCGFEENYLDNAVCSK